MRSLRPLIIAIAGHVATTFIHLLLRLPFHFTRMFRCLLLFVFLVKSLCFLSSATIRSHVSTAFGLWPHGWRSHQPQLCSANQQMQSAAGVSATANSHSPSGQHQPARWPSWLHLVTRQLGQGRESRRTFECLQRNNKRNTERV